MTDKEQIMIDGVDVSGCSYLDIVNERIWCDNVNISSVGKSSQCPYVDCLKNPNCHYKQLARKTQECNELKIENEELNNRMAKVIYRATGGRLSYSNYTLDAIEQAFNDQLEILSDQKIEEETKELNQKLYLVQNEVHSKIEYIQEQKEEIKQLEQKYEELKNNNKILGDFYESVDTVLQERTKKYDRYRKTLEEIEKVCIEDTYTFANGTQIRYDTLDDILDIINKAKEN